MDWQNTEQLLKIFTIFQTLGVNVKQQNGKIIFNNPPEKGTLALNIKRIHFFYIKEWTPDDANKWLNKIITSLNDYQNIIKEYHGFSREMV